MLLVFRQMLEFLSIYLGLFCLGLCFLLQLPIVAFRFHILAGKRMKVTEREARLSRNKKSLYRK